MFQYHCLNPIAEKGLKLFGDNYKKTETADQCDAILVRSAKMHDMELPRAFAQLHVQVQASIIFRLRSMQRRGLLYSTRLELTQTA